MIVIQKIVQRYINFDRPFKGIKQKKKNVDEDLMLRFKLIKGDR